MIFCLLKAPVKSLALRDREIPAPLQNTWKTRFNVADADKLEFNLNRI